MTRTEATIRILSAQQEESGPDNPSEILTAFEAVVVSYGFGAYLLTLHANGSSAASIGRCLLPEHGPVAPLPDIVLSHARGAEGAFRIVDALSQVKRVTRRHGVKAETPAALWRDGYAFPVHTSRGFVALLALAGGCALPALDLLLLETVARHLFRSLPQTQAPVRAGALSITRRERETLSFLAAGLTSNEIAKAMSISAHTVDWYVNGLQEKLSARNRHHLVAVALRSSLCG